MAGIRWVEVGGQTLPVLTKDMITKLGATSEMIHPMGDNQQPYEQYTPERWDFTEDAKALLNSSGVNWSGQRNNIEWQLGITPEEKEYYQRFGAVQPSTGNWDDINAGINPFVKLKTADKEATNFKYEWNEEQQAYTPKMIGTEGWDTNASNRRMLQTGLAALALMAGGAAATGAFSGAGGAAAGGAGGAGGAAGGVGAGAAGLGSTGAGGSIFGSAGAFGGSGLTATGLPGVTSLAVPASIGEAALLPAGLTTAGTAGLGAAGIPITAGAGLNLAQVGVAGGIPSSAAASFGIPAAGFPGADIPPPTNPTGPDIPLDKLGKVLSTVAGTVIGGTQADQPSGPAAVAPFTPSGAGLMKTTYEPNKYNMRDMQGLLSYLGKDPNEARGMMGGGQEIWRYGK